MTTYTVFRRKAYKRQGRGYAPNPGARRTRICTTDDIERARAICADGPANKALAAGREYRGLTFYEFTSDF